jgi:hypothetical protein
MSGGTLGDYSHHRINDFITDLRSEIASNGTEDEWGHCHNYSPTTIAFLQEQLKQMETMATMMHNIDLLYASDHSENSFREIVGLKAEKKS